MATKSRINRTIEPSVNMAVESAIEALEAAGHEVSERDIREALQTGELQAERRRDGEFITGRSLVRFRDRLEREAQERLREQAEQKRQAEQAEIARRERVEQRRLQEAADATEIERMKDKVLTDMALSEREKHKGSKRRKR